MLTIFGPIVQRNVAQCFKNDDSSALAALAYAVHQLKVEAIIVCGKITLISQYSILYLLQTSTNSQFAGNFWFFSNYD